MSTHNLMIVDGIYGSIFVLKRSIGIVFFLDGKEYWFMSNVTLLHAYFIWKKRRWKRSSRWNKKEKTSQLSLDVDQHYLLWLLLYRGRLLQFIIRQIQCMKVQRLGSLSIALRGWLGIVMRGICVCFLDFCFESLFRLISACVHLLGRWFCWLVIGVLSPLVCMWGCAGRGRSRSEEIDFTASWARKSWLLGRWTVTVWKWGGVWWLFLMRGLPFSWSISSG